MAYNLVSGMFQRIEKLKKNAGVGPSSNSRSTVLKAAQKLEPGRSLVYLNAVLYHFLLLCYTPSPVNFSFEKYI